MTEKRFMLDDAGELIDKETAQFIEYGEKVCDLLNELHEENEEIGNTLDNMVTFKNKYKDRYRKLKEENEQLKQYKQAVSDVLLSYSQKNLSAKQLGLLTAIMHELGVLE